MIRGLIVAILEFITIKVSSGKSILLVCRPNISFVDDIHVYILIIIIFPERETVRW